MKPWKFKRLAPAKQEQIGQIISLAAWWALEITKLVASLCLLFYSASNYLHSDPVDSQLELLYGHENRMDNAMRFDISLDEPVGPRIFCLISTTKPRHGERAVPVRATWARRCDGILFASDFKDQFLPSEAFYNKTGREYVSFKMFTAWRYVYDRYIANNNHGDHASFQWFVKADDDTFVVVENLRKLLTKMDHTKPHYMGRPLTTNKTIYHHHYVSGSMQIFSIEALRKLVTESMPYPDLCPSPRFKANEDAFIGYCLHSVGVKIESGRDELKRNRFMLFSPWNHLHIGAAKSNNWIWRYDKTYTEGENCCAPDAVSFHYQSGGKMLSMEFLLYHLKPFGIHGSVIDEICTIS